MAITYKQDVRILKIQTTLGDTELVLEKFSGTEAVSSLFEFNVTMLSTNNSVDIKSLLRTSATITVYQSDGTERKFNGVFKSISQTRQGDPSDNTPQGGSGNTPQKRVSKTSSQDVTAYEGVVVPKAHFLKLDSNCKMFQNMTVPDIVGKVLKDNGVPDYSFRTNGSYPPREYCVQYRESSMDFISRLLEEEGIFYNFEHTDSKHTMVFADKSSLQPACSNQPSAEYAFHPAGEVGVNEGGVGDMDRVEAAHTGQVAHTDYNFEKPSVSLMATLTGENEEAYDYPGEYTEKSDGDRYATIRLEEREAQQFVTNGTSGCRGFQAGSNFKLTGHPRDDSNQDYFLTSVSHQAVDATYRQGTGLSHGYSNNFSAMPKSVPYRPPRKTPRPTVKGPQPALVVGKAGEEIWCDKYGRVKVQFYWDRDGQKNEDSSCWIRVSQVWAGKGWGGIQVPRIGQEVLVDFLEGNPDNPVIIGRVYNADQMPPYTLPDNQTQSGIKSRSSKGGGSSDFNEIRMEDMMGQEMFTMHAQKDMETMVEHDDTQTVQNNRTINVDGSHTETIVQDMDITISQGNQSTTASLGSVSITAMQSITLTVGDNSITINQMGVTIQATMIQISGTMITLDGDAMLTLTGGITMINS
ncbi:MAG: type VI secretion system Vgr family protein [Bryobacteraceae bacterium]